MSCLTRFLKQSHPHDNFHNNDKLVWHFEEVISVCESYPRGKPPMKTSPRPCGPEDRAHNCPIEARRMIILKIQVTPEGKKNQIDRTLRVSFLIRAGPQISYLIAGRI